ncbi:MAG: ATPase, T2SS/T4P/T4SS family [Planctomycetota bacterium]
MSAESIHGAQDGGGTSGVGPAGAAPVGAPPPEGAPRMRIGDELLRRGLITEEQLQLALAEQRRFHRPLGEILVSLGFVKAIDTARLLSEQLGIPIVSTDDLEPDPLVLESLDTNMVRAARAFPLALDGGTLQVAMVDPTDPGSIARVRDAYPYPLSIVMITPADLEKLLRRFQSQSSGSEVAELLSGATSEVDDRRVEELCDAVVRDGIRRGATDIHIQPEEHLTRVRYRIDGVLRTAESLPRDVSDAVISRVKISSRLDIAERRRPQDGRMRIAVDGREVDLRVSVMPNVQGENLVLRVLDRTGDVPGLEELGVTSRIADALRGLGDRPNGLFLVTGPTGSGKTTTLYSILARVDSIQRNVATIEDPVEYSMPLVRQSQVDGAVGYGFHEGLRALLRQDPDVILIGEIRDEVTADMAIKAAMTGHLVLATLHTTNALGAVPRLVDLGIPAYLLEDTLVGVMSQRLVRKLCDRCTEPLVPGHPEYERTSRWLGGDIGGAMAPVGCSTCDGSGFAGRIAMAELFVPTPEVKRHIRARGGDGSLEVDALESAALASGFLDMGHDAADKVRAGLTTLSEVLRVHVPRDVAGPRPGAEERSAA